MLLYGRRHTAHESQEILQRCIHPIRRDTNMNLPYRCGHPHTIHLLRSRHHLLGSICIVFLIQEGHTSGAARGTCSPARTACAHHCPPVALTHPGRDVTLGSVTRGVAVPSSSRLRRPSCRAPWQRRAPCRPSPCPAPSPSSWAAPDVTQTGRRGGTRHRGRWPREGGGREGGGGNWCGGTRG